MEALLLDISFSICRACLQIHAHQKLHALGKVGMFSLKGPRILSSCLFIKEGFERAWDSSTMLYDP